MWDCITALSVSVITHRAQESRHVQHTEVSAQHRQQPELLPARVTRTWWGKQQLHSLMPARSHWTWEVEGSASLLQKQIDPTATRNWWATCGSKLQNTAYTLRADKNRKHPANLQLSFSGPACTSKRSRLSSNSHEMSWNACAWERSVSSLVKNWSYSEAHWGTTEGLWRKITETTSCLLSFGSVRHWDIHTAGALDFGGEWIKEKFRLKPQWVREPPT